MAIKFYTLLAVFCCSFFFKANAQTTINLGDDAYTSVNLGFDLTYFGETFDKITIYTNGMTLFGNNNGYAHNCCDGYSPTEEMHDYGLFPFWTDIIGGSITYQSDNIDSFSISWDNQFEYYNQQTNNTFGLDIKASTGGALIDFWYDELDIRNHNIWSGLTGDISEDEVVENFFHNKQDGVFTGGSELDFTWNDSGYVDCSNPLNDPSCSGYEEAYFNQQCSSDPLYNQQCPGYEQAYTDQQCSYDPLYDPSCSGYEKAYEDQQCSADPLWSPKCPGYQMAYEEEQCKTDSQWSSTCPGYKFETFSFESSSSSSFEDFSLGDTGEEYDAFGNVKTEENEMYSEPIDDISMINEYNDFEPQFDRVFEDEIIFEEESFSIEPELDEFIPEEIKEAIEDLEVLAEEQEERKEIEEANKEIEEDVVVITETTPTEETESGKTTRRSGSRIGLSVGLGTASSLVAGIISNSIESGQSAAAQGTGSGGYFESGQGGISAIAGTGVSFTEMKNGFANDTQGAQSSGVNIDLQSFSLSGSLQVDNFKFEIKEQSLAEKMADSVRKKNLDNQSGIFNKQITQLENIANGNNLNKYYAEALTDATSFYNDRKIYEDVTLRDKADSLYRMQSANYGLMQEIIRSQY